MALALLCKAYEEFPTAAQIHPPDKISMLPAEEVMLQALEGTIGQLPDGKPRVEAEKARRK
jgi:hypothetical protein